MSGEISKISQMPIVLIPIHFDRSNIERTTSFQRSVVIRPFITQDFMTGVPAIPGKDISVEVRIIIGSNYYHVYFEFRNINSLMITLFKKFIYLTQVITKMVSEILTVHGISRVLYDLTPKPPGTTEWE